MILEFIAVAMLQAHPCDTPALTGNINVTNPVFTAYACAPASEQADGIVVKLNNVDTPVVVAPAGPANAAGKVAYPYTVTLPSRGNNTVQTRTFTLLSGGGRQEGPLSVPFVLVYEKAVPVTAPTNHPR